MDRSEFAQHVIDYADTTLKIAKQYVLVGKWDTALDMLECALKADLDDIHKARLWCVLGNIYERRSDYGLAESVLLPAQKIAEREHDEGLLADVLFNLAELAYFRCFIHQETDHQSALQGHEHVLAMREKLGDEENQCFSLSRLGTIHERISDMETALDYFNRSIELGEKIGFEPGIWRPLVHIAFNHLGQDDLEKGLALQRRAHEITQAHQITDGLVYTIVNVAYAQFLIDRDVEVAIQAAKTALAMGEGIDFKGGVGRTLYMIGMIAMEGGDTATAIEYFRRTVDYSTENGFKRFVEPAQTNLKKMKEELS